MTAEFALSIFGAVSGLVGMITSVIAVWIALRQHFLDRPNLKVDAKLSISWNQRLPEDHLAFEINAINAGRRVIRLRMAGIEVTPYPAREIKKGLMCKQEIVTFFNAQNPTQIVTLEENETFPLRVEPLGIELAQKLGKYGTAFVEDTTGKRHRAKFHVGSMPQDIIDKTLSKKG